MYFGSRPTERTRAQRVMRTAKAVQTRTDKIKLCLFRGDIKQHASGGHQIRLQLDSDLRPSSIIGTGQVVLRWIGAGNPNDTTPQLGVGAERSVNLAERRAVPSPKRESDPHRDADE